jgi:homoserine dehydrogenase
MIRKPNEVANTSNRFRLLIAGHPGIGKTTLALSSPKPLLIDVDLGINRVMASARKDYIQPENYEEVLSDLRGDLSDYETIVIDTGGKLIELMKAYVMKQDIKNAKKDGTLSLQGYGAVAREFTRFMYHIYYELKKHVVIIFHAIEEKEDELTKLRIMVEGSTKNTVWQNVELGGFIEMIGKNKTIGFENCEKYFAKSSFGVKGVMKIPELDDKTPNDFLTKLFKQADTNIQAESSIFEEQKEDYEKIMKEYIPKIDTMTTKNVEEIMKSLKDINHVLTSEKELKARFSNKIKELNLVWNKESMKYEISNNTNTVE